jgi:hypothetical protein
LDTLAVIGDAKEFKKAVGLVVSYFAAPRVGGGGGRRKGKGGRGPFDYDVTVSVFETNIRLLGGLLSAHLLASHSEWWDPSGGATGGFAPHGDTYDGALLVRAPTQTFECTSICIDLASSLALFRSPLFRPSGLGD